MASDMQPSQPVKLQARRYHFRLISLFLFVFVVCAILASWRHWQVAVTAERKQLDAALKRYRDRYGQLPVSPADPVSFRSNLRRAFPRYQGDPQADLQAMGLDVTKADSNEALVFWLGGMPEPASNRLTGFDLNPAAPFARGSQRTKPLFEFDPARLSDADGDGWLEYRARLLNTFELPQQ